MKDKKLLFFYIIWGIFSFLLFAYILFPKDLLSKFVMKMVENSSSDVRLSFDSIDPIIPPGVKFDNIDIYYLDSLVYKATYLKISPGILSLFSDTKNVKLSASAYKGIWKCKVNFSNENLFVDALLKDVHLDHLPIKQFLPDYKISGILNLDSTCDLNEQNVKNADIDINVKDLKVRFGKKLFGIRRLLFNDVQIEADAKDNKLEIKTFNVTGKQVSGKVTGTIDIKVPYEQSALDIKGTVNPDPEFIKKLSKKVPVGLMFGSKNPSDGFSFTLKGTIEDPEFIPEL